MSDSEWIETHVPCPLCGSSDAASINDRGWMTCFSCGKRRKVDGEDNQPTRESQSVSKKKGLIPFGEYRSLNKRKLTEETCRKFGYFIGSFKGSMAQVAPYRNRDGVVCAQKVRTAGKDFCTTGEFKHLQLFGQHLWKDSGKMVVVTEGEIDCMSVSQIQGNKWAVVSIPNGAQGAEKSIKDNLEWLLGFQEVILMFDMDEAGVEATQTVAQLFPPGKCKVASLPLKDANEMLQAGRGKEVISAIWDARAYRPDGIVEIDEILDDIEKPIDWGLKWFLPTLSNYTYGRRYGELYAIGAGTGCGKTDLITQQIAYDVKQLGESVGVIFLESKPVEVGKRIAGKVDGQRYHVPDADWSKDQLKETLQGLKGKVIFYDNWGDTEWEVVKKKIRFMAVSRGIRLIYLDHLTAMADTSNEKESIEQMMKEMAGLANELGIIIHFVSHLSTPEGKAHEEGGRVMIKHFKGSRSIGFWSYYMLGIERNTQAEDEDERHTTTLRVLKDRYTGQATGNVISLYYDTDTGLISEEPAENFGFDDGEPEAGNTDF